MRNQDLNKDTKKVSINRDTQNQFLVRPLTDFSEQAWKAFMLNEDASYVEFDADHKFNRRYTRETDTNKVTKVENDGSNNLKVTTDSAHGYDNGNNIVLGMFSNPELNIHGTVSSKTDTTFVVTEVTWSSNYSNDAGYACKVSDKIEGNESRMPSETLISERIPWGILSNYYPNFVKEDANQYGDDVVIVLHVKQVTSIENSNIRITER